jgi:hypothetical protein
MSIYLGNRELGALLTLAAQGAGTVTSPAQSNQQAAGIKVIIDITAITGTSPTLTVTIEGRDPVSGKTYPILVSAALNAVATTVLTIFPGIAVTANVSASDHLPLNFDVKAVVAGTGPSVTATISATLLAT